MSQTRRRFLLGAAAGAAALSLRPKAAQALVLGGGPAGASAALLLARQSPHLEVTLVERDPARFRASSQAPAHFQRVNAPVTPGALTAAGVSIVLDEALGIDWRAGSMELFSGRRLGFDRIYLAPGSEALPEGVAGYDARARHLWPAAWGNLREAQRLRAQMAALPRKSHVVLRLPREISHPKVALERALWLAGTGARLTVLDGGHHIALRDQTRAALPGRRIDWHHAGEGGIVTEVDVTRGRIETDRGAILTDAVNFVPLQGAGRIARAAGLVDASGWCPVDERARSRLRPEATILGDGQADARRVSDAAIHGATRAIRGASAA